MATGPAACGSDNGTTSNNQPDGSTDGMANADAPLIPNPDGNGSGGDGAMPVSVDASFPCDGCAGFPPPGAPQCPPATLGNPTIAYPTNGLLLPPNMNVLEVQWLPPAGATLFEVDFSNGVTSVRVETPCIPVPDVRSTGSDAGIMYKGCGLTLPQAAWNDIANTNRDGDPVQVTVRATINGACVTTSTDAIAVSFAKEDLAGGIYYWQSAVYGGIGGKTGGIYSHDFGTFDPTPTPFYTSGGSGTCVGCHNLSRDGARISLGFDDPDADDEFGDVHTQLMDVATRTSLGGAMMSPGFQTFTHDHATLVTTTFKTQMDKSFGEWNGDTAAMLGSLNLPANTAATQPDLSRDDADLVFVVPAAGTISMAGDHHFKLGTLWTAPVVLGATATLAPTQILGAAGRNYYYPSFAPDSSFIVFDDAPDVPDTATANGDAFYNRDARVKLLHNPPQSGDTPIDLPNLDVADGLSNSWPRWSPFVQTYKNHHILWVTFSSNRDYGLHLVNKGFDNCYPPESPAYDQPQPLSKQGVGYDGCAQPQIWMAAIIVDPDRALDAMDRSYPAFWLPFQDVNSHNHSAQWVEKVQGPPGQDGGVPPGGDAGDGAAGTCGEPSAACGAGALCCSDAVCCNGSCAYSCLK